MRGASTAEGDIRVLAIRTCLIFENALEKTNRKYRTRVGTIDRSIPNATTKRS